METEILTLNLRNLRAYASQHGIQGVAEMDRSEILHALSVRNDRVETMRRECAERGLPTTGTENELKLRLSENDPNAIRSADLAMYRMLAIALGILGCLTLAISVPHIAKEIERITGLHIIYSALLAIVIDLGIVGSKILDLLSVKFELGKLRSINKLTIFGALTANAMINLSGFNYASKNLEMAAILAFGLSFLVWFLFTASGYLFTRQEKRKEPIESTTVPLSHAERLRKAADILEHIEDVSSKLKF